MNLRLTILLLLLASTTAWSQLATVYVDATNGSDSFSGANATDSPSGTGPKATIHAGLDALSNNGRLILFAGLYAGDGVDTDGSPTNPADNADINISTTKYPRLTTGLTIELRALAGNNEIRIVIDPSSVRSPNGALINHTADQYVPNFIYNIPGGSLTITTTGGSEYMSLAAAHSSGSPVSGLFMNAGTMDIVKGSSFRLLNGSTITMVGSAKFVRDAPQKGNDINVIYTGAGSYTAGPESGYPTFGSGILTVNRDANSSIIFPFPMTFSGNNDAVRIQSGSAAFNGALTLGSVGSGSTSARTADLIVSTSGVVVFNAPVNLVAAGNSNADSALSGIDITSNATVSFQQPVTWTASYNSSDVSFPASEQTALVWNTGGASVTFASGAVFSHAATTVNNGAVTVDARIQNNGSGRISFGAPISIVPRTETSANALQQFSISAINNGGGTLEVSGTLRSGLINSSPGGTINLLGATTLGSPGVATGSLVCAPRTTLNLGGYIMTLAGNVGHTLIGSGVVASEGSFVVRATGSVSFDGAILPAVIIDQQTGSTQFGSGGTISSLTLLSGTCLVRSNVAVTGLLTVNGGSLVIQDSAGRYLSAGEYRQTGGILTLGGLAGGDMKVQGNFTRTAGTIIQGSKAGLMLVGVGTQLFDPGTSLQLMSLDIENQGGGAKLLRTVFVSGSVLIGSGAKLDIGPNYVVLNGNGAVFTNNGSYKSVGFGIVLGGSTLVDGGQNISAAEIRAGNGSSFSSIAVDVGNANACLIKGLAPIAWTDTLAIISGGLDVASAVDLRPSNPSAMVLRDVSYASRITTSAGTFNAAGVRHTVRCIGNLLSDYMVTSDLIAELANADTLLVDVNSDAVDGDGNLTTGQINYFEFPRAGFVFGGSLIVSRISAVQLEGNGSAGESLELNGANRRLVVRGILKSADVADQILISGASVTVTGGTNSNEVSLVGNLAISSSSCTISGLKGIMGSLTTLAGSTVSISLGASSSQQRIQGALTLNGAGFSLSGNVEVMGGIGFNSGQLNFGSYNLQLTSKGDFLQGQNAAGYSTTGGFLVMNRGGAQVRIGNSSSLGIPNLQILSNTNLAAPGWVTRNLTIGSSDSKELPTLTLGKAGNDLIFTGSTISILSTASVNRQAIISDGTTNGTTGGRLFVAGASVLMILNGDYSIEELMFNPPSADGSFSILSTDQSPHVLAISDILTHAGGQIGLGMNHLALTGTGTLGGQRAYNRSDGTIGATSGELRFTGTAPQQFVGGPGFVIPNLRIWNARGVTKASGSAPMTITGTLDLSDGLFTFDGGTITLENGGTVVRRRTSAILNNPVSYHGVVSVSYILDRDNGNLKTGIELPTEAGGINNVRINAPSASADPASVLLDRSITLNGTLFLDAGQLDLGASSVTLASGGTLDVTSGSLNLSGSGILKLSTYSLIYRKSAVVGATNPEFQSGSGANVSKLSIYGSIQQPTNVILTVNKTIGSLMMGPGATIEFGPTGSFVARNLTVKDSLTVLSGGFNNTTGTAAIISLAGTSRQIISVDTTDLALQGGGSPIHVQLNNPAGFELRGGDLIFNSASLLLFANGVLFTGSNAVALSHSATGQGFDRQGVTGKNLSHVAGIVRQNVTGGAGNLSQYPNGRYEFPTGTFTEYRPLAITFTNVYPALTPGTIEVTYVAAAPGGSNGFPIDGGGLWLSSYANFYWQINASGGSFGTDQYYDLETSIRNPGINIPKAVDLRYILRPSISPVTATWRLLGSAAGYSTSSLAAAGPGDTTLTVRVLSAGKGFAGANYLTIGVQSRGPVILSRVPTSTASITLNVPITFKISAVDPGNQLLTYTWKVDGVVVKKGSDSTFSTTFTSYPQAVTAICTNPSGLSDSTTWSGVVSVHDRGTPTEFVLGQNYPNPFNPSTNLEFRIASREFVQIRIFNVLGVEVARLVNEIREPGVYTVRWNASSFPSGIFLCQMRAGNFVQTKKLVLMK
jgi:hypothetical protein